MLLMDRYKIFLDVRYILFVTMNYELLYEVKYLSLACGGGRRRVVEEAAGRSPCRRARRLHA